MIVIVAILGLICGLVTWNYLVNNPSEAELKIPVSNNLTFPANSVNAITPSDIMTALDDNRGRPVLIYFYTMWCHICKKQMPVINEMARKFQNTDLKIFAVAVDNNINEQKLILHLQQYPNIYFQPYFLAYNNSLKELLKERSINYRNRIPFVALIGRDEEIIGSWDGYKSERYINAKIIRSLIADPAQERLNGNTKSL